MSIPFKRELTFEYGVPAEVAPGVQRIVARNGGPFTFHGTGTYVIGRDAVAVIDPGPRDGAHLGALLAAIGERPVSHILVTHTHPDHSPGAAALAEATGAPTLGFGPHGGDHSDPAVLSGGGADLDFVPDERLADGARVEGDGFTLEAVHTPGHCSNHLCFAMPSEGLLFTGDQVMGWSTTVVAPPDGDMGAYVRSLEGLVGRDDPRYVPAHGPTIDDPKPFVRALIDHRRAREAQILRGLAGGPRDIPTLVQGMYADVRPILHHAAARSVFAHMLDLHRRGAVSCEGGGAPTLDAGYRLA